MLWNTHKTVQIGEQVWMAENLKSTHYADGIPLVNGTGVGDISGDYTTKYWFVYDDNAVNKDTYGLLYTWAAVMNGAASSDANPSGVQGVCPSGWHLPSDNEWKELEMYLGMLQADADNTGYRGTNEGSKLAGNSSLWFDGALVNDAAFGTSGFLALPGGYRGYHGSFIDLGYRARFWSATEDESSNVWSRALYCDYSEVYWYLNYKTFGFSVRCIKDN